MRESILATLGRVLLAALFLLSGLGKLGAADATIAYITSAGLPFPSATYLLTLLAEIGGGLSLLIGFKARAAAAILALFSIAAAVLFHGNVADQNQMVHFIKNFAIAGGLLQMAAVGAGRFSLDAHRADRKASEVPIS
jgi:putative oxidoreductase